MSEEKITYSVHDYGAVNKYIDEKSRIRNTKSVWGYTKSLTLFLLALGIFFVLIAYAYHLYKKKHDPISNNMINNKKEITKIVDGEKVVYSGSANRFESVDIGQYIVVTGYKYSSVDNLRFGKQHTYDYCYLERSGTKMLYYFDKPSQDIKLKLMGLSKTEAESYKRYCKNK